MAPIERISLFFYLVSLALWLGGAFMLTFVVAPKTIQSMPSRGRASTLITTFLKTFDIWKIIFILGLIAFTLMRDVNEVLPNPTHAEIATIFFLALSWVGNHMILAPRMDELRVAIGCFDSAPPDAPARKNFARLHSLAMFLTLGDFTAGLFLLFFVVVRWP
jgi:hypothetical protein